MSPGISPLSIQPKPGSVAYGKMSGRRMKLFESLDDRNKENLLGVIRRYTDIGIQHVITLIDSDLPAHTMAALPVFEEAEIVVRLHDENEQGKLFKMKGW